MPRTVDDDTWSVNNDYYAFDAIDTLSEVFVLMFLKVHVQRGASEPDATNEYDNEIKSYVKSIMENSTKEWYENRLSLFDSHSNLLDLLPPHDNCIKLAKILAAILMGQFGREKLVEIIKELHDVWDAHLCKESPDILKYQTEYFGHRFDANNAWYHTNDLKILLQTLRKRIVRVVFYHANLGARTIPEVIDILNAVPEHVTEINMSKDFYDKDHNEWLLPILQNLRKAKLILKLSDSDFGLNKLTIGKLNAIMRVMPPRTHLRIQNISSDCCLQSKARLLLHKILPAIETENFKILDAALSGFLNNEVQLQHIVDQPQEFIRHLVAHNLMHSVLYKVKNQTIIFENLPISSDAKTSDVGLEQFIKILENYKTPLSYLCCALLLTDEIHCYEDTSKNELDTEEYWIKRYADAFNFYKLAAADLELRPTCRQLLSRIKHDLKQRYNPTDRFKSFLQHTYKICNSLDAAPVLVWHGEARYNKDTVVEQPAKSLSIRPY